MGEISRNRSIYLLVKMAVGVMAVGRAQIYLVGGAGQDHGRNGLEILVLIDLGQHIRTVDLRPLQIGSRAGFEPL